MKSLEDCFWEKVDKKTVSECWPWKAAKCAGGYGHVFRDGKTLSAHRISYEIAFGSIEKGLFVCHKCDNRWCVNPSHLFLGTAIDNMRDRDQKGRQYNRNGEKNGRAKLTENLVKEIRKKFLAGDYSQKDLSREYNISHGVLNKIINNKLWKSVI